MNIKNICIKSLTGMFISIILLVSCGEQNLNQDINDANLKGTLAGKISIGPLCPVETNPPLPECQPTEETYKAWAVAVWSKNKKSKIEVLNPNLDGTFETDILAGDYIIDFESKRVFAVGGSNLPISITIEDQKTTEINIDIDTGIR